MKKRKVIAKENCKKAFVLLVASSHLLGACSSASTVSDVESSSIEESMQ